MKKSGMVFLIIGFVFLNPLFAAPVEDEGKSPRANVDRAVGEQNLGSLHNLFCNVGRDAGWESPRMAFPKGIENQYVSILAIQVGMIDPRDGKPTVIESYGPKASMDWEAADSALGLYHSGEVIGQLVFGNAPIMATSDRDSTWPKDASGKRFWPGAWRIDPPTGNPVTGEFAADRQHFAVYDDRHVTDIPSGPLGIRVYQNAYSYGRFYAEDIIFFETKIVNTSSNNYTGVYAGYAINVDCGRGMDDYLFAEKTPANTINNHQNFFIWRDYNNSFEGEPIDAKWQDNSYYGVIGIDFLKTPKEIGVTDFHYFVYARMFRDEDNFQWFVMSSKPDSLGPVKPDFFHGSDPRWDDVSLNQIIYPTGADWVMYVSTGPFDIISQDTVSFVIAVIAGDSWDDLHKNLATAEKLYSNYYQGSAAPPPPNVQAYAGDKKITLYWDNSAEITKDPMTKLCDFEGYRIYRSVDQGKTWGRPIFDANGRLVNYVPLAQFDLVDSIKGYETQYPFLWLGNETGLRHSFTDSTVLNGVEYWYAVCAYDKGDTSFPVGSLESVRGISITEPNIVSAVPGNLPQGYTPPQINVTHTAGRSKGSIEITVVDPSRVNAHNYQVTFEVDSVRADTFNLYDVTQGEFILTNLPINNDDIPVVHGFRAKATGDTIYGIENITDQYGYGVWRTGTDTISADKTNKWYVSAQQSPPGPAKYESKVSDYEIRFTPTGSIAYHWMNYRAYMRVPFEVWNISDNRQVNCTVTEISPPDTSFDLTEKITIFDSPYVNPNIGDPLPGNLSKDRIYYVQFGPVVPGDTTLPLSETRVSVHTFSPFTVRDTYSFGITPPSVDNTKVNLNQVRVVPNPYIVSAPWETQKGISKIMFTHLPEECTINIYTLSGDLVRTIEHKGGGYQEWDLLSHNRQQLAYGLYIYVVKTKNTKQVGKFAIIR